MNIWLFSWVKQNLKIDVNKNFLYLIFSIGSVQWNQPHLLLGTIFDFFKLEILRDLCEHWPPCVEQWGHEQPHLLLGTIFDFFKLEILRDLCEHWPPCAEQWGHEVWTSAKIVHNLFAICVIDLILTSSNR